MSSKSKHIEWSDWVWSDEWSCYYRTGLDRHGREHYEYQQPEADPRHIPDANVDDLTANIGNVAIQDPDYYTHTTASAAAADYGSSPPTGSSSKGKGKAVDVTRAKTSAKGSSSKLSSSKDKSSSSKGVSSKSKHRKGKHDDKDQAEYLDPFYAGDRGQQGQRGQGGSGQPAHLDPFYPGDQGEQEQQEQDDPGHPARPEPIAEEPDETEQTEQTEETDPYTESYPAPGTEPDVTQFFESELEDHPQPMAPGYGYPDQGDSFGAKGRGSTGHRDPQEVETEGEVTGKAYPAEGDYAGQEPYEDTDFETEDMKRAMAESRNAYLRGPTYGESSTSYGSATQVPYDVPDEEDGGAVTPRAATPSKPLDIRGTGGAVEELDPRYIIEPSIKFQPGEVFKILWSEPEGSGKDKLQREQITEQEERTHYGQRFYVGFRRFIVVANDEGHCTCVPILTYGGKGCKKRGVKPNKHGVVYQLQKKPRTLENEPKLGFQPVAMVIEAEGEKLARESRVNYSKLVTIEHNVKVFFIGRIITDDLDIVSSAVDRCWEEKIRKRKKEKR